ncbi:MAG: HAD family hydrolase [Bacteroidetes bacterium]|nr:HAD family hydrolase [Bacteroidota bacterium]
MIKLIMADMDGTLLDDSKSLSHNFWEIEEKLAEKGILFAVASGRQFYNLIEKFDKIKDRMLFLAENGTYVYYKGKEIHVNPLDRVSAHKFLNIGRAIEGVNLILCGKNSAYVESSDSKFLAEARQFYKRIKTVNDLTEVDDDILKVTICDFKGAEKNAYHHFKEFEKDYKVAVAGKIWLDMTHVTANKGTAIRKIQNDFGISFDETMVFGDFLNDMEMMQSAKHSYAMKNAHPEIIKASAFVTQFDNNNNGVMETISRLCL